MTSAKLAALACVLIGVPIQSVAEETMQSSKPVMRVGTFQQQVPTFYGKADGLPDGDVFSIAIGRDDAVYAGAAKGLFRLAEKGWTRVEGIPESPVVAVCACRSASANAAVACLCENAVYRVADQRGRRVAAAPEAVRGKCLLDAGKLWVAGDGGVFELQDDRLAPMAEITDRLGTHKTVRAMDAPCVAGDETGLVVAAADGLFTAQGPLHPRAGSRSWAPHDVRGVAWDKQGNLWFASPHGVARRNAKDEWTLFSGEDGLPYDDLTCVAAGDAADVWFGTTYGAIHFNGKDWEYRQGRRWLPNDYVRSIAIAPNGDAWIATADGVARIERRPMTLAAKAKFYEDEIDKRHRRTPYGYVLEVQLKQPGDKSEWIQSDSDNDGLWTGMYGAGECFAYAASQNPDAKRRAKAAFEALRFLGEVTQGGSHPAPKGFVARSILPTSGPDPNKKDYTREKDEHERNTKDALWKVIAPRWPTSADGKWYWKCDTSSDELDGHYFLYARYYDWVADTEEEKQRVRDVVAALTDHLIEHDFCLVDWDGKPTRWAVYGPEQLNRNPAWADERGLNSLSMLSYLSVAEHVTGDPKYRQAFDMLVRDHGYAMNLLVPKIQNGPGSGNQSDDEMAFMSLYNLVLYAKDPVVRDMARWAFRNYWLLEQPELNPFFDFAYVGVSIGADYADQYGKYSLTPPGPWLEQSVDTLLRFPLDLCDWRLTNSHRKDIVPLPAHAREGKEAKNKGYRRNGLVLPVDERSFNHWNCDPWDLDTGHNGRELPDGAVFLLPYYMGLYHGFIVEEIP